jgi:hypothetical protein
VSDLRLRRAIEALCGWGVGRDTGGVDRMVPASDIRAVLDAVVTPRMRDLIDAPWCLTCWHTHIPDIPATTFACASECGFGSWDLDVATNHAETLGHNVYPLLHTLIPAEHRQAHADARTWVTDEVHDWYDPVIHPDLHDTLRVALGMRPYNRED